MRAQRWSITLNVILLLSSSTVWSQTQQRERNQQPRLPFGLAGSMTSGARQDQRYPKVQVPAVSFTFGTIDYPDAPESLAQAINNKGEIVGWWGTDVVGVASPLYGFTLKGGSFKKIVYPGASITVPSGVNDAGEIVGYYSLDPKNASGDAFTLVGTTFTSVAYPGAMGTVLTSINKSGQMVGYWVPCYGGGLGCPASGFLLSAGVFTPIQPPGAAITQAFGINDTGEIVGTYSTDGHTSHGFTLLGGVYTTVDYPGATDTYLYGLNNSGQIVGEYDNATTAQGFLLETGTFTPFAAPWAGLLATSPFGINDKGIIVGQTVDENYFSFGFEATIGK